MRELAHARDGIISDIVVPRAGSSCDCNKEDRIEDNTVEESWARREGGGCIATVAERKSCSNAEMAGSECSSMSILERKFSNAQCPRITGRHFIFREYWAHCTGVLCIIDLIMVGDWCNVNVEMIDVIRGSL